MMPTLACSAPAIQRLVLIVTLLGYTIMLLEAGAAVDVNSKAPRRSSRAALSSPGYALPLSMNTTMMRRKLIGRRHRQLHAVQPQQLDGTQAE